jgi:predicted nucleotidyltransferase
VCLFGSSVRGTLRDGSDIDFLVVIKEVKRSYHKRIKEIIPLLDDIRATQEYHEVEKFKLHIEPCFLVFTADEIKDHPPILLDISQEGIILFDKENFLKEELTRVKETLVRLGSRKKITPHGHYWTLKPDIKPGEIINI